MSKDSKEATKETKETKDKKETKETKKDDKDKKDKDGKDKKDDKEVVPNIQAAIAPKQIIVHPLVLLSVTDHFTRVGGQDTGKRVVGILLGESYKGKVDVTNSYAVPFEEDSKDLSIWFLDHNYHEDMFAMFKKVNAREKVVGWYSTGPKIRPADLEINELLRKYTANPLLVIVDVNPQDELEIPTQAYMSVEGAPDEKSPTRRTFVHLPCEIGAQEAEEVGVEHLLRNIRESTGSTLTDQIQAKLHSLKGLKKRMEEMLAYLNLVVDKKLPVNHQILYNLQDMFNLLPDLKTEDMVKAFSIKTNDNMLVIYLSSLVRSIIALHNLINNKLENRLLEAEKKTKEDEKEKKLEEKDKKKEEKEKDGKKDEKKAEDTKK